MGGTCDPQLEGAQARSRARSNIAGPPRGPAPSRRSITGHGAQKAGAHTLCAHPLARRPRVLVGASARHERAYIAPPWTRRGCRITRLGPPAGGSVLSSCSVLRRRRAACWQSFGGHNKRGASGASARAAGRIGGVLGACRRVAGDVPCPWPCHWHARISQRRRVGELEPKTVFLGVSGQFHELVKRRETRLRASRARSGGAPGRAQLVALAQRARRRLAGLARRAGSGRADCT